jgi:hypothetical protein
MKVLFLKKNSSLGITGNFYREVQGIGTDKYKILPQGSTTPAQNQLKEKNVLIEIIF